MPPCKEVKVAERRSCERVEMLHWYVMREGPRRRSHRRRGSGRRRMRAAGEVAKAPARSGAAEPGGAGQVVSSSPGMSCLDDCSYLENLLIAGELTMFWIMDEQSLSASVRSMKVFVSIDIGRRE